MTPENKACKILDKHINKYENKMKDLVYSGKTSDRYFSEPSNKQKALKDLKNELIEKNICPNYEMWHERITAGTLEEGDLRKRFSRNRRE